MKEIPLTKGLVALVDDEDYELLIQVPWHVVGGYAKCQRRSPGFKYIQEVYPTANVSLFMHRVILKAPPDCEVDHRSRNTLDNRKCNLRLASKAQNQRNAASFTGVSKYKGVYWHEQNQKWVGQIGADGQKYLGSYNSEIEAALAYDRAAHKLHGEFARYNFPEDIQHLEYFSMPDIPVNVGKSGYVGVYPGDADRWLARARVNNKAKHLGCFESAYDAALYRDYYIEKHNLNQRMNF